METYNKKEIAHLIVKRLQGELSAEEDALLDAWRKESPRNEGAYHRYQSEAFYRDMHALYTPGEEKSLYKQLRRRLIHRRMKMSWGGVRWIAASLFLLCLAWGTMRYFYVEYISKDNLLEIPIKQIRPGSGQAVLFLADGKRQALTASPQRIPLSGSTKAFTTDGTELALPEWHQEEEVPQGMNRIEVPRGGEYKLQLSDGSRIHINSESEMQFPTVFNREEREVAFRGEAYFAVAHTENSAPFVINTSMGRVEVLGTSFNLRCYDTEACLCLTLEEGQVRFITSGDQPQQVTLSPGERLVYYADNDSLSSQYVYTPRYTSWHKGFYVLDRTPLGEIMDNLSRWYNVPIGYENKELKDITFSGELKRYENFGEIVQILGLTKRIRFTMKGNAIYIIRE